MHKKINEIFCFVVTDRYGDEGIPALKTVCPDSGDVTWLPMVGADKERIESMKTMARKMSNSSHNEVRLLKFTTREEIGWE